MKQNDRPVTKAEFDEGMQMVTNAFENVVTHESLKETLKDALEPYATKQDLQEVKEELLDELKKYATKDDMRGMLDSAVERIEDSVLVTQRDHGRRITALERR